MQPAQHSIDAADPFGLLGKRALVVGAGMGIGLAAARTLSACGMTLALVERDPDRLAAARTELGAFGLSLDVTADGAAEPAVAAAVAAVGPLDVLVNIVGKGLQVAAIEQTRQDQLEMLRVNYLHHVEFCSAFARSCIEDGRPGAIALVSSLSGVIPFPRRAAYGAAKAALGSMVASMAVELGPSSIRVNAVAPGVVRTDRSALSPGAAAEFAKAIPLGRIGDQQDVANAILFLCSDLSRYLTGQTIVIDGGASLYTKMWP